MVFCREFYSRWVYAFFVLFFLARSALVLIFTLFACLRRVYAFLVQILLGQKVRMCKFLHFLHVCLTLPNTFILITGIQMHSITFYMIFSKSTISSRILVWIYYTEQSICISYFLGLVGNQATLYLYLYFIFPRFSFWRPSHLGISPVGASHISYSSLPTARGWCLDTFEGGFNVQYLF